MYSSMAGGEVATWIHGGGGGGALPRQSGASESGRSHNNMEAKNTYKHTLSFFFFVLFRVSVGNDKTVECVVLEKKQVPTEKRESLRNKALNLLNLFELNR